MGAISFPLGASDGSNVDYIRQLFFLVILAIPIASVAWTVTHEEIFREPRDWCVARSKTCRTIVQRKFFYLFTCEYCFSHYVTAAFLYITRYRLLFDDWRGYLIAGFSLVAVANLYMSLFGRLRGEIKQERVEVELAEESVRRDASVSMNSTKG
jgi:hypothetical protein